jgi:inositol oxygenase
MDTATPAKAKDAYRNYETPGRDTVREFYRLNHAHQTHDFVLSKKADFLRFNRRAMTPWEALDYLNTLVDDSDPTSRCRRSIICCKPRRRSAPTAIRIGWC